MKCGEKNNMKQRTEICILLLVIGFIGIVIFSAPLLMSGPPLPDKFSLENRDNNNHVISIEFLDSNNKSIFKETYTLKPGESVREKKSFYEKYFLRESRYKVNVTLDSGIFEESSEITVRQHNTARIDIYPDKDTPILISIITI